MAKESSRSRGFRHSMNVTVANGPIGTGSHKASLRFSIRLIPSSTRSFSLLPGRFPTAHSTRREVQSSTFRFGRMLRANFRLLRSNIAISQNDETRQSAAVSCPPTLILRGSALCKLGAFAEGIRLSPTITHDDTGGGTHVRRE